MDTQVTTKPTQAEEHRRRIREECQEDVIFLFRIRRFQIGIPPQGYEYSDDLDAIVDDEGRVQTEQQLLDAGIAHQWWDVDSVWLDREEAEHYGDRLSYRFGEKGKGWQVYGVSARGDLAKLLRSEPV